MSRDDFSSYNLVDQPWLLARTTDGDTVELSLVDTFRRAHVLIDLVGDVPTQVFALTRLLVAVLHGSTEGPRDVHQWEQLWRASELPVEQVERYLTRHRAQFDLFDTRAPFLQVAGLRTANGEVSGVHKLIADVPNGRPFFSMRLGGELNLSYAEAARWVVHCQAFDPSGIKSGAVGDERVRNGKGYPIGTGWAGYLGAVVPEGSTLRDTLLLNLVARDFGLVKRVHSTDLPAWERGIVGAAEEAPGGRPPTGPVDLYTWQSRRIRLIRTKSRVTGALICNGERITPQNKQTAEPHTAWRRSTAQELKLDKPTVYMPKEHTPGKVVWRELPALLPGAAQPQDSDGTVFLPPEILKWIGAVEDVLGHDYTIHLHAIGMIYGSQSSTTVEIFDDRLPLRAALLRSDSLELANVVKTCVTDSEAAANALGRLASNLAAARGGSMDRQGGPRIRAVELCYAELDVPFRRWLNTLNADTDIIAAQSTWHDTANRIVRDLGSELIARAPAAAWKVHAAGQIVTPAHAERQFWADLRRALPQADRGNARTVQEGLPTTGQAKNITLSAIGTEVHARIQALQEGVLADRSFAHTALALLRRGVDRPAGSISEILQYTALNHFAGPDSAEGPTPEETAAHVSMTLYAVHQQSQRQPMHQRGQGLGRAARRLHPDEPATPSPLLYQFRALSSSECLDDLVRHLRGMVQMLRTKATPLDYALLADELVLWQCHHAPTVRLRWGRDFYRTPQLTNIA